MTTRQTTFIDTAWHPLVDGNPPSWVSGWGQDKYGVWVAFTLKNEDVAVTQRLRWMPAGDFLMGSPPGEPGRVDSHESPQHRVVLSKGFWLFDTPVIQALWQAVMNNDNPSRFKSPDRPVERVSWDDCQQFIKNINQQIPGLNLILPSEAQWEYGCRADELSAIYTGDMDIIGDGNAPALNSIGWYGGNSGEDFELDNGQKKLYLNNRQFDSNSCGTHPVALKQPNSWGLYDMFGNVYEWTADSRHDNYQGAPDDGSVWDDEKPGAVLVVRGGSWHSGAQRCRSAYCGLGGSGYRDDFLGFRCCARLQV